MAVRVNCRAPKFFQTDVQVPKASTGDLATPAAGAVTGLTMRLAATPTGPALDPSVGGLPASERVGRPARFYVEVSAALLTAHVLPLGVAQSFWAIWSIAGVFDLEAMEYRVADGLVNT